MICGEARRTIDVETVSNSEQLRESRRLLGRHVPLTRAVQYAYRFICHAVAVRSRSVWNDGLC